MNSDAWLAEVGGKKLQESLDRLKLDFSKISKKDLEMMTLD